MIGARVTLRYPDAWWKEIRIDKGGNDGVRTGAPALSDGFIIGKVARVGDDYSWIELATSSSFLLAAVVVDTWDLGVINGDDMGNIWLLYTPPEKEFKRGMTISTALVGDYLPPGIPIGTIWGQGEPRDGFIPQKVVSGAHLTQLYNVQILRTAADAAVDAAK
jgi:rod shape-determining protein MreC